MSEFPTLCILQWQILIMHKLIFYLIFAEKERLPHFLKKQTHTKVYIIQYLLSWYGLQLPMDTTVFLSPSIGLLMGLGIFCAVGAGALAVGNELLRVAAEEGRFGLAEVPAGRVGLAEIPADWVELAEVPADWVELAEVPADWVGLVENPAGWAELLGDKGPLELLPGALTLKIFNT